MSGRLLRPKLGYQFLRAFIAFIFVFLSISGCGRNSNSTLKENLDRMRAQLLKTDSLFAATSQDSGAAEAFRMYLAPDAMQMPSRANPIYGREEICKHP